MTVDEILASGEYIDRRGRQWDYIDTASAWCTPEIDHEGISWGAHWLESREMRLLIERDQHRDECPGLYECTSHPVAHVLADGRNEFVSYRAPSRGVVRVRDYEYHTTLPDAMDAAYRLAVGE